MSFKKHTFTFGCGMSSGRRDDGMTPVRCVLQVNSRWLHKGTGSVGGEKQFHGLLKRPVMAGQGVQ